MSEKFFTIEDEIPFRTKALITINRDEFLEIYKWWKTPNPKSDDMLSWRDDLVRICGLHPARFNGEFFSKMAAYAETLGGENG